MMIATTVLLTLTLLVTNLGQYGTTCKIHENDAMQEIMEKAQAIDKGKLLKDLEHKFRNYRPKDLVSLDPAHKSYSYRVDPTYTLAYDIPRVDSSGKIIGVLYPKGYQFNPLDYLKTDPRTMVIFNGDSPKELKWVNYYYKGKPVAFLMTQGDWGKVSQNLGTQVYYLKKDIAERLKLKNTVSIVYRQGRNMRVDVYALK